MACWNWLSLFRMKSTLCATQRNYLELTWIKTNVLGVSLQGMSLSIDETKGWIFLQTMFDRQMVIIAVTLCKIYCRITFARRCLFVPSHDMYFAPSCMKMIHNKRKRKHIQFHQFPQKLWDPWVTHIVQVRNSYASTYDSHSGKHQANIIHD